MPDLYVFDLDGTLVNSLTDLAQSVNKGLVSVGLPTHPEESFKAFVGNGREILIQRAMGKAYEDAEKRNTVRTVFDAEYALHSLDNTRAYEGCGEMLSALLDRGAKIAVLSNKPDEFVKKILDRIYPDINFTLAWGQQQKYKRKPSGEALCAMLELLDIKKRDCLYFGDSDVDVYTAKDAGVEMCGVLWGFRSKQELIAAGARTLVSSAEEILYL